MPIKLDKERKKEVEQEKADKAERKARRQRQLAFDDPEVELLPKARTRLTLMQRIAKDFYEYGDEELGLVDAANKAANKMRYAHKKMEEQRLRVAKAQMIGRQDLVDQEDEKLRAFRKDFIYYQFVVGQLYLEFMDEVNNYG